MKNINPLGLFDNQLLLQRLTKLKDPLVKLEAHIDWQLFAPILQALNKPSKRKNMGRPPFDRLMMFKLLILQHLYNLSDDQTEYQITDRLSFKRFLGLKASDNDLPPLTRPLTLGKFRLLFCEILPGSGRLNRCAV